MSLFVSFVIFSFSLFAVEPGASLRGRVVAEPKPDFTLLRVAVYDANDKSELGVGPLHWDGSFQLKHLPEAVVEVVVLSPHGEPLARRYAAVPSKQEVDLKLPRFGAATGAATTLYHLSYKPAPAARKEWILAAAALRKHDSKAAIPHLDRAISLSPGFAEAHEHRGLIAMADGQLEIALQHLLRASEIDPEDVQFLSNAALACLAMSRDTDAERLARRILKLEPGSERGYFILGTSLARQNRNRDEAIAALNRAMESFPESRRILQMLR